MRWDWRERAACLGEEPTFFATYDAPEHSGPVDAAKRICEGCPVRLECLREALEDGIRWGVWGGFTGRQRRRLLRGRRRLVGTERGART